MAAYGEFLDKCTPVRSAKRAREFDSNFRLIRGQVGIVMLWDANVAAEYFPEKNGQPVMALLPLSRKALDSIDDDLLLRLARESLLALLTVPMID